MTFQEFIASMVDSDMTPLSVDGSPGIGGKFIEITCDQGVITYWQVTNNEVTQLADAPECFTQ